MNERVDDFRIVSERIEIRHETVENFKHDPNQILVHVQLVVSAFVPSASVEFALTRFAFRDRFVNNAKTLTNRCAAYPETSRATHAMLAMTPNACNVLDTCIVLEASYVTSRERMMKIKLPSEHSEMMRSLYQFVDPLG